MDKPVGNKTQRSKSAAANRATRPSRAEAEAAVRTLIRWAGDNPDREGLLATPGRVVRAYEEWFAGYKDNPRDYLKRTFEEHGGYDEVVARVFQMMQEVAVEKRLAVFLQSERGVDLGRGLVGQQALEELHVTGRHLHVHHEIRPAETEQDG